MQYITSRQMTRVDQLAVESGLEVNMMMENAGHHLARFVHRFSPKDIVILFGKGNNGGDGLAAARHLSIIGYKVQIVSASKELNKDASQQLKILATMGIKPQDTFSAGDGDMIIDALLGYNIKGNPRDKYAQLVTRANAMREKGAEIVSFDTPTGIDPDTGASFNPSIKPDYILTLALPKTGLKKFKNVFLANLGIPKQVYTQLDIEIDDYFRDDDIIQLTS